MKATHAIASAAAAILLASCANQSNDGFDTYGYDFDDFGTPDGQPFEAVNPVYDSPAAFEETRPAPAPATPTRPAAPPRVQASHTVVRGDTLWGISRKYGVSIDSIKQANNMRNDTVVLGTTLTIPAR